MASGATEVTMNGESADTAGGKTPAQVLQEQHEAAEAHKVSVEDVQDEEDIAHPPPSHNTSHPETPAAEAAPASNGVLSEKAAGKQKAQEPKKSTGVLDTQSEELFPTLGGGPKPRAPAPVPMAWGAKRNMPSRPAANGASNGIPASQPPPSTLSSRASTPLSGIGTPASTNTTGNTQPYGSRGGPQLMSMPGKFTDHIQLAPSQMVKNKIAKPILDGINRRSKARVSQRVGPNQSIVFEGTGPQDAVRQALKQISKELGVEQNVKIPVPVSIRPHIIGKEGSTIKSIMQQTGAKIQVPKGTDGPVGTDEDDSVTIDIEVAGDPVAAGEARRKIEEIVSSRTSTVNLRLRDIPPEFFPFIAGPRNSRIDTMTQDRELNIEVPHYHTWQRTPPPQAPKPNERPLFVPHSDMNIRISGDRNAAQEARMEIERQVEELRQQLMLEEQVFQRGQHQFIIGDRGMSLHDFLDETGCAVVLPPDTDDTESVIIIGPADRLEDGINRATALAAEMQMSNIDLTRYHNAEHSRALTRYLMDRQLVAELEAMHNAHIVVPSSSDGPLNWEIFSREGKNGIQARGDIVKILQAHPSSRISQVQADPFFHSHVQNQFEESMLNELGVRMVIPTEDDDDFIVLAYEGIPDEKSQYQIPRQRPTSPEVQVFEEALRQAQNQITSFVMADQQDLSTKEMPVPRKFHDKVRKFVGQQPQPEPPHGFPADVSYGPPGVPRGDGARSQADGISLRGPTAHVGALEAQILAFLEEVEQEERERGYTTTVDFPQKFANQLIGKRGEHINRLREEYDVDIKINDGKVEVKGPQKKADSCAIHIKDLAKKFEDEAFYTLKVESKYHRELIGQKGVQVRKLEDRHNVHIQFPSSRGVADDQSVAETASEAGGNRRGRNNNPPADEIWIRGPRQGADKAKSEILDLVQFIKDHAFSATVSVAQKQVPSLMGKGGGAMDAIRLDTGAQIDVPNSRDAADASGRVDINIRGTKAQVDKAKALLQERGKAFDEIATRTIDVDKKHLQALIGSGGSNIRRIVLEAGGPENNARVVRFPDRNSNSNTVTIEGPASLVSKVYSSIATFVNQKENQTSDTIDVPTEKHRMLIGRGGEVRRNLESQFNVTVDIPKQGSGNTAVKISGASTDVSKAKEHIAEMTKEQVGETVKVPKALHHSLAQNGNFFRKLRNDHSVTVDHGGQRPPPRPKANTRQGPTTNGTTSAPLITDDPSASADLFQWEVVDNSPATNGDGDASIPWILTGSSPENVAKAKALIEKALAEASKPSATGYLVLPDPKSYRLVVGVGGREINRIRDKTGCKIQVPKAQGRGGDDSEAIEIVGSAEGVEEAKEMILETVKSG